jgi:hypothetical protein
MTEHFGPLDPLSLREYGHTRSSIISDLWAAAQRGQNRSSYWHSRPQTGERALVRLTLGRMLEQARRLDGTPVQFFDKRDRAVEITER